MGLRECVKAPNSRVLMMEDGMVMREEGEEEGRCRWCASKPPR